MKASAPVNGVNHRLRNRRAAPSANGSNGRTQDPPAAPSANGANGGRDGRGRFARGNAGGPGNPFARRVAAFRRAVCAAVTEDDLADVARCLVERAKGGDVAAAKLLFAYALGRPAEAVDPDTLDLREWQLYQRQPVRPEDFHGLVAGLPVGLACTLFRQILPCVADTYAGQLRDALAGEEEDRTARKRRRKAAGKGAPPGGPALSPAVEDRNVACTPAADGPDTQGRPRGGRRGKKPLVPEGVPGDDTPSADGRGRREAGPQPPARRAQAVRSGVPFGNGPPDAAPPAAGLAGESSGRVDNGQAAPASGGPPAPVNNLRAGASWPRRSR